jgi:DNA-directed RNA polymerase specialized sigma24 family protein
MTDESDLYDLIQGFRPMAEKAAVRLPCEADDILHEAFVKWVQYVRRFAIPGREQESGFAFVLVRNTIADMIKRRKVETKYDEPYQKERLSLPRGGLPGPRTLRGDGSSAGLHQRGPSTHHLAAPRS